MDTRDLETFLAVVRLKTLKAASEHLHLAQSSVSKRVQLLEQECGITLFERYKGSKRATLTPYGERFVEMAERMLEMFSELKNLDEHEHYMLNLGAVTSLHATLIPEVINRIIDCEPRLQLNAKTLHSTEMYDEIDSKHIDIGFTLVQKAHPNVAVKQCFSEPILVMRPAEAAPVAYDTVKLQDLDFTQEIYFPWTPYYESRHRQWSPTGSPRVFVDDPTMLASLLRRPGQWAFVPLSMVRYYQKMGTFKVSYPDPRPPERACYMVVHKQPTRTAKAALEIFRRHLNDALKVLYGETGQNKPELGSE